VTETPNTRTEANRKIIRQAFEAWQQRTGAITDLFAPDMVWRIEGHSLASKQYNDRQQFIDEVLTPFGARFATSEPFRPTAIRSVHADGDTAIVVWDGRGIANDGSALREQLRLDHEAARRQGHRRHRVLRQHLVQ
jgi:ketosteroid isomerase-like protein